MANGISLHIGINRLDPERYPTWNEPLSCPENDAQAMFDIAQKAGFQAYPPLLTENARAADAIAKINRAADTLVAGDIFFLSFAGHGTSIPAPPSSARAEAAWLLYDRMVFRSELDRILSRFRRGVRLLAISDSCESGDVLSELEIASLAEKLGTAHFLLNTMPSGVAASIVQIGTATTQAKPANAKPANPSGPSRSIFRASTIFLASSRSDRNSVELVGATYSLFTQTLLTVWHNGKFPGNYHDLYLAIGKVLLDKQDPAFKVRGPKNQKFQRQKPFTI